MYPGDGGLIVLPGSHKTEIQRPQNYFFPDLKNPQPDQHPEIVNITPKAGDIVVMPECMTHGVLPWTPKDRQRRIMMLRYRPQHRTGGIPVPDEVVKRLEPEVRELIEEAHYTHVKQIAKSDRGAA